MATTILIPTPLRPYTDKKEAVEASGATIGELLIDLTTTYSGLKAHLYNDQGKLRSFVNIYINDEDIRYLQKDQTPVSSSDTVYHPLRRWRRLKVVCSRLEAFRPPAGRRVTPECRSALVLFAQ